MSTSYSLERARTSWAGRLVHSAPVRILLGALAAAVPVALVMAVVQHVVDRPHRQLWPHLLAASLCLLAYRGFVHVMERRALPELAPKPALREVLTGTLFGCALVCTVCATLGAAGVLHITGSGAGSLIQPLGDMALAAIVEEVLFRAVLFRIAAAWLGTRIAFVASSLLFALAHLPNNGFSLLAFVALVVAGMLLAAAYLMYQRLWLPIGVHFGWNYTTEGVFGLSSSGQAAHGYLQTQVTGPDWLSGGAFGVEASIVTLAVTAIATALLLALQRRGRAAAALVAEGTTA
jgi:hypothetical protein